MRNAKYFARSNLPVDGGSLKALKIILLVLPLSLNAAWQDRVAHFIFGDPYRLPLPPHKICERVLERLHNNYPVKIQIDRVEDRWNDLVSYRERVLRRLFDKLKLAEYAGALMRAEIENADLEARPIRHLIAEGKISLLEFDGLSDAALVVHAWELTRQLSIIDESTRRSLENYVDPQLKNNPSAFFAEWMELPDLTRKVSEQRPTPTCFTGKMRVQTPQGERTIEALQPGDAVFSLDLSTGRIVENTIAHVHRVREGDFTVLSVSDRKLETNPLHSFYLPDEKKWAPLVEKPYGSPLLRLGPELGLTRENGCSISPHLKRAPLFNLEMIKEPRNFFIEGILVHNGPIIKLI